MLRANAALLGVACTLVPTEIVELISIISGSSQAITLQQPQPVVAVVLPGLTSASGSSGTIATEGAGNTAAFKPRNFSQYSGTVAAPITSAVAPALQSVLGFAYNAESGFVTNAPGLIADGAVSGAVGEADTGTELAFQFSGPPNGTMFSVPNVIYLYPTTTTGVTAATGAVGATGVAVLVGSSGVPGTTTQLTITGGSATATYEVLLSSPTTLEFAFLPSPGASITTSASFGPTSGAQFTTYTYKGNNFTTVVSPYTTSDSLTFELTYANPLGPNAFGNCYTVGDNILSFTLFDGINTYRSTDPGITGSFAFGACLSTDSSSKINQWYVSLLLPNSGFLQIQSFGCTSECASGPTSGFPCTTPGCGRDAATEGSAVPYGFNTDRPGTWSISRTASADSTAPIPRFLGSSVCPVLIPSTQILVTASGLAFSRVSGTFNGTVTITNISGVTINGPFQVAFAGLFTSGFYLVNATGVLSSIGTYLTVPEASLSPGQSATVKVQFQNLFAPPGAKINFTPVVFSGSLN